MAKALKVTVSGSYRTANKEIVDFENLSGLLPVVDEDLAAMHVQTRYVPTWLRNAVDKKGERIYTKRIEDVRQVFIDEIEKVNAGEFSYVGKDIKNLEYQELQDLATAKDLRRIPLPKELSGVSLREMRQMAYVDYSDKVLKKFIDHNEEGFNFSKLPPLIIDGDARRETSQKITNEEILDQEQKVMDVSSTPKSTLTIDDLKGIAKQKGISHHPNIGFDALYAKIYGGAS